MQQHIAVADGGEDVRCPLQARRNAGREAGILEVGPVHQIGNPVQAHQVHGPVAAKDIGIVEVEFLGEEPAHSLRTVVGEFQPHRLAEAARRKLALHRHEEVVHGLFVHQQVAVAGDPELIAVHLPHARKQLVDVRVDDRREEDERVRVGAVAGRHAHHPRQRARRLHHGHGAVATERVLPFQGDDEGEVLVDDAWERMRGVKADGRENRRQFLIEIGAQPAFLAFVPFAALEEADALRLQEREQHVVQHPVLLVDDLVGEVGDALELLGRGEVVRAALGRSHRQHLLQARDTDFEELVEVGAGDAQEAQPLEQGHTLVLRLLEHTPVELEHGELAVDVEVGALQVQRVHEPLECASQVCETYHFCRGQSPSQSHAKA